MALSLSLKTLFGAGGAKGREDDAKFDEPTTQVKMGKQQTGYDPLAAVSMMEQMRAASTETRQPGHLWVIGHLPIVRQFQVLGVLLAVFILLTLVMLFLNTRVSTQAIASGTTATEMRMLSQRLARGASLAVQGNVPAFEGVKDSRDRFRADLDALTKGGSVKGVSLDATSNEALQALLKDVTARWAVVEKNATDVVDNQPSLVTLSKGLDTINKGNNELLELAQQASAQVAAGGGTLREGDFTNQLAVLSQRIAKNANSLVSSEEIDPEVAFLLGKDAGTFREILNGLLKGSETLRLTGVRAEDARATLTELQKKFASYQDGVNAILQNMSRLVVAKRAARVINQQSEPLLTETNKLTAEFDNQTGSRNFTFWAAMTFAAVALLWLILLGKVFLDDARVRAYESEQENKRNQEAILRLLNEMGNLADGDLTVQASVTEDVTGAIADSINFTIEELRTLVKGINSATDQVAKATQDAKAISNRLYESSQRQSKEIQAASASVLQMAQSINEVSQTAAQSARVAQQSLAAAEKGGQAVHNQIAGMNEIRSQIQDTAKPIKRLGESSLEIGEIVELISDITEQTNVLALNAAIQAASAGEAGRGFTVVAEEVQRLAERSAEATKHISAIVKSIQRDTQDAVEAMERSTQGVVQGTKTADEADQALREIGQVSNRLAGLIGSISTATQQQAESATKVAANMKAILAITQLTTEGTKQTAASAAKLTALADGLKSSVSGFKLA